MAVIGRDTVIARLRLVASPSVITGPYPNEFELMKPLPRLGPLSRLGDGAHVQLEGSLAYPVAKALLARVLVGREFEQSGRVRTYLSPSGLFGGITSR